MTDLSTTPQVTDPATGDPLVAHIIRKAEATDAYVFGTPIEALCGITFVPTRDPDPLPVCSECEAIMARHLQRGEN